MKIGIVHFSGPPILGGVERIIEAHSGLFLKHGHQVRLIVGAGEAMGDGVEVKRIPELDALSPLSLEVRRDLEKGELSPAFFQLKERIEGKLEEATSDLELVIVHNILSVHFNLPATAALHGLMGKRKGGCISWCHDCTPKDPTYTTGPLTDYPWSLLGTKLEQVRYVAISQLRQSDLADLIGIPPSGIEVIPDGVGEGSFLGLSEDSLTLFDRFGLRESAVVMLFPTRIVRRKNIELGIRVVHAMREAGKRGALLITGPPDPHNIVSRQYYEELRGLAADLEVDDRVIFLSVEAFEVDEPILRDLYLLSDILFLPSLREGFGIPLLEAGLAKLPVFCSEIEPLTQFRGHGPNYFSLDQSPEEIARRIIQFLSNDPSSRMFKGVLNGYTWSRIYEERIGPLIEDASRLT